MKHAYHKFYNFAAILFFMLNLTSEIKLQTTRSGGKGGQNVNKVETAVIATFAIDESALLSPEQKKMLHQKLANRINNEGCLLVKAQTYRTQLENKSEAIEKIQALVTGALKKKKMRVPTKPSKSSQEKRLEKKKQSGAVKEGRRKLNPRQFF